MATYSDDDVMRERRVGEQTDPSFPGGRAPFPKRLQAISRAPEKGEYNEK
jgi:hypothetical protein